MDGDELDGIGGQDKVDRPPSGTVRSQPKGQDGRVGRSCPNPSPAASHVCRAAILEKVPGSLPSRSAFSFMAIFCTH